MHVAYCTECSPVFIVGTGIFSEKGKKALKHQVKDGSTHAKIKVVEVADEQPDPRRGVQKFLDSLAAKYKDKLV